MLEKLLRRTMTTGWRRGRSGSRFWMVLGTLAAGVRLFRWVARDKEEILYRTRVVPGDRFEIVALPPAKR